MSHSIYKKLCLPVTLYSAWKTVKAKNSAGGIDGQSVAAFEENLKENLDALKKELLAKTWNPEPYLRIDIPKKNHEKRQLGLLSVRDKIVQQAIKSLIEPRFEKIFINNSYGYRPGKGPVKAIRRVNHFLAQMKNGWIAKLDIDNYFDTIPHDQLFSRLSAFLGEPDIVRLIELCTQMGMVNQQMQWNNITKGVPQGAVLSPLLANFYLHSFDQFVVTKTAAYIRYADDFVVIADSEANLACLVEEIKNKLSSKYLLQLNQPEIQPIEKGVEFLGIWIRKDELTLSPKKLEDLKKRIETLDLTNNTFQETALESLAGIKNYYGKLLPNDLLKELDITLVSRIFHIIQSHLKDIPNKTTLKEELKKISYFSVETNLSQNLLIKDFESFYLKYKVQLSDKPKTKNIDNKKLIDQKKQEYRKRENEGSEWIISTPGCFIARSNQGIIVRLKGKNIYKKPSSSLKHLTVIGKGISLSSDTLSFCTKHNIPIDFFDSKGTHFATLCSPTYINRDLWERQVNMSVCKKKYLARRILEGKLKNQLNLIKYYHKYHKNESETVALAFPDTVLRIEKSLQQMKEAEKQILDENYAQQFMGFEAHAANAYWEFLRLLMLDDQIDFQARIRQGANDLFNSLLNYGYAIMYARIWNAVIAKGLNPSVSVLHVPQEKKPTLVYDLIEIFRAQAVDRVVISLVQKGEPLKMKGDLLSEPTKKLLIQNVIERINRYEKYRGEEIPFTEIIKKQIREVVQFIMDETNSFKPYIAKW